MKIEPFGISLDLPELNGTKFSRSGSSTVVIQTHIAYYLTDIIIYKTL